VGRSDPDASALGKSACACLPFKCILFERDNYESASLLNTDLQVSARLGSQSINLCCRSIASDSRRRAPLIVLVIGTSADLSSTMWLSAWLEVWLLAAAAVSELLRICRRCNVPDFKANPLSTPLNICWQGPVTSSLPVLCSTSRLIPSIQYFLTQRSRR